MTKRRYFFREEPISILDVYALRAMIQTARGTLDRHPHDPGLAATLIKTMPALKKAGLDELAWLLAGGHYGCHRNDVLGLFEYAEAWITEMLLHVAAARIRPIYQPSSLVIPDQAASQDHQNLVQIHEGEL